MAKQAVLEAALKLSEQERVELAEQLLDSVELHEDEPRDPQWESAWTNEIARRLKSIDDGSAELIDADQVHRELRAKFRSAQK